MNPTKEKINSWIEKANFNGTNDIIEFTVTDFINNPTGCFKRFLLEMKVQIERWDLVVDYLFLHPRMKSILISSLKNTLDEDSQTLNISIWGTPIINNIYVPENIVIAYTDRDVSTRRSGLLDTRNIVIGKLDLKMLDRIDQMKAFW